MPDKHEKLYSKNKSARVVQQMLLAVIVAAGLLLPGCGMLDSLMMPSFITVDETERKNLIARYRNIRPSVILRSGACGVAELQMALIQADRVIDGTARMFDRSKLLTRGYQQTTVQSAALRDDYVALRTAYKRAADTANRCVDTLPSDQQAHLQQLQAETSALTKAIESVGRMEAMRFNIPQEQRVGTLNQMLELALATADLALVFSQ